MESHDIFLVFVEGSEGNQDAYAEWFGKEHMADMMGLPDVISASAYRLETLDGQPIPAQLCAIYETGDGPGILATVAATKGTDALPASDIQGRMTWRVLEGTRASGIAQSSGGNTELICMFGRPWDEGEEARLWQWLCDQSQHTVAMRLTRLSPVQPSRGSEYSTVLFATLSPSADAVQLANAIDKFMAVPGSRFLLARQFGA